MPDNIERTIFKLELDGSAYVEGADKVTASTNKLSQAQEAANKKLKELEAEQANYKKQLQDIDVIIKENEKETIDLTKKLNDLKAAEKGTSAEAKNLQTQLRGISTNTKEFKIEAAALKTNLTNTTQAIATQRKEITALTPATGGAGKAISSLYSGLRTLANIIPGLGISGMLLLIGGPLVDAITTWIESMEGANDQLKLLKLNQENANEVMEAASKSAGKQITDLKILYQTATDTNASIEERRKAVKALQQEFPDYFGNIKVETILNGEAKKSYDELAKAILATARATAAKAKIDELEAKRLDIQFQKQKIINATNQEIAKAKDTTETTVIAGGFGTTTSVQTKEEQIALIKARRDAAIATQESNDKLLQAQEDFLIKFAGLTNIANVIEEDDAKKFKDKKDKQVKTIENIYEQELQKLKADIAKLTSTSFTTEASITKAIEEDFKVRDDAFEKAFKNKQLTAQQLASLQGYLKNLQDLTLKAQLKSFRETKQAYLQAISDEITSLQVEESAKRIQTIQDSFERERQTILSETEKTETALIQRRDKSINDILKNAPRSGLSSEEVQVQIDKIKQSYTKLLDDLEIIKNQRLQQLSFETFEAITEDTKRALDAENLGISQGSLVRIKAESDLFQQGKISFAQYQKALTEIAKSEAQERFNVEVAFLRQEIKIRQDKLALDKDLTDVQITRLRDEIRKLEQQLADAEKGNIIATNAGDKKKKTDSITAYADAIGKVISSVIQFWQSANEAEQKALDRSISLQETRVAAAQKIADRGNAQYLRSEVDRLNELNVARENAARKQLGIDAALQASQILVGITGAISKIATPGIGAAETIAEIAIIIGALATGYGLVKSLQGNQPRLYKGTKYLKRDGEPSGIDTIPVRLTEGEAVISRDTNREYSDTVAAVYDKTVPASDLNDFVRSYHKIKPVPQPNYERIKEVAELKMSQDGKMSIVLAEQNNLLKENTELQKQTLKAIKAIGISVNMDKNGFALSFLEAAKQHEINKKL